jgi:hypothetical protein
MKALTHTSKILWYEVVGFVALIALSWVHELTDITHSITGVQYIPDWGESIVETVIVAMVAIPVMIFTRRLVSRLYRLEGFLRVCAWCKKLEHDGKWIPLEEFFERKFQTETSHGMCPACSEGVKAKMKSTVERERS